MSSIKRAAWTLLLVGTGAALLGDGQALAATTGSLTVQWDANTTDQDLAGYRVFLSTDSGVFSLTPAQAATVATVRTVGPTATETILTSLDTATVYWVAVTSFDTSSNESVFSNVVNGLPADVTPPTVSLTAPVSGASLAGTVTISANASDDVGVSGVQFRLDGNDLGAEDTAAPYAISWSTASVPNGAHTLTAVARDAAGNSTTSGARGVTVNNSDTTPPSVSITAPGPGASLIGTVNLAAVASDNVGVAGVQFKVDGTSLGAEDTIAPYSVSWNTTVAANGTHTLTALARDAVGNKTTSTAVSVLVSNPDTTPPSISMTAPVSGSTLLGVTIVSASASDNVGVAGVQFKLDGNDLGAEDASPPYAVTWSTTLVPNGPHTLAAVARDAAGNTTTSASVAVVVSNTDIIPPSVSITAPAAGASVAGVIPVSANASDNVGVIGVQFQLDGSNLGALVLAAPFTVTWDTTRVSNGVHTLTGVALDAAGNIAVSAAVEVVVSQPSPSPCASSADADRDGICDLTDNCPGNYNPSQENTDADAEGGDACDITVTFPLNGDLTCADGPPTITWSPEIYGAFRVSVGATVSFSVKVTSGKKSLTTTSWSMPPAKWASICKSAKPFLFIKVQGRIPGTKWFEYSEVSTIVAK